MINIVVPMAGRGSKFAGSGEVGPKPLIEVIRGKRMIEYVIDYLTLPEPHRFIFICLEEHERTFDFDNFFRERADSYDLVLAKNVTRGPAATVLLAADYVNTRSELLIAYCDSFLTVDPAAFLRYSRRRRAHGALITYPSQAVTDSYAALDANGRVIRTAEKEVISPNATAGFYYFSRGSDYVAAACKMLAAEPEVSRKELFVCPVYNELIGRGKNVVAYSIDRDQQIEMGTPQDLAQSRQWLKRRRPLRPELPELQRALEPIEHGLR